jgi:hypothetical protein
MTRVGRDQEDGCTILVWPTNLLAKLDGPGLN